MSKIIVSKFIVSQLIFMCLFAFSLKAYSSDYTMSDILRVTWSSSNLKGEVQGLFIQPAGNWVVYEMKNGYPVGEVDAGTSAEIVIETVVVPKLNITYQENMLYLKGGSSNHRLRIGYDEDGISLQDQDGGKDCDKGFNCRLFEGTSIQSYSPVKK